MGKHYFEWEKNRVTSTRAAAWWFATVALDVIAFNTICWHYFFVLHASPPLHRLLAPSAAAATAASSVKRVAQWIKYAFVFVFCYILSEFQLYAFVCSRAHTTKKCTMLVAVVVAAPFSPMILILYCIYSWHYKNNEQRRTEEWK